MNIMIDDRFSKITSLIDTTHNVFLINTTNIGDLSSNIEEDLEIITEKLYINCVDKDIELVITTKVLCDKLSNLGINTIAIN